MKRPFDSSLEEEAAVWLLRLHDEDASPTEIEAALLWQDQSPNHRAAFERATRVWHMAGQLQDTDALATYRRPIAWKLLAAVLVPVMVIVGAIIALNMSSAPVITRYATKIGEIKTIVLSDKSEIILGGASTVVVAYTNEQRHITLTQGEALFHVAANKNRPFIVESGGAEARAYGTIFDVHLQMSGVTVTVAEGVVQVQPVSAGTQPAPAAWLGVGHQVRYSEADGIGPIARVLPERATEWKNGKFIFSDSSLTDVIADIARYSPTPILLTDPEIGNLRVTGVVSSGNLEEWLRSLAVILPVTVNVTATNVVISENTVGQKRTSRK